MALTGVVATAVVAVSLLRASAPASAEEIDSPLDIPLLTSEDPAPITPTVPLGEPGLNVPPPGAVHELVDVPPIPMDEPLPANAPGRTVFEATRSQGTGSAPQSTDGGAVRTSDGAPPALEAAPIRVVRLLSMPTRAGVVHGTHHSYWLAV